MQKVAKMRIIHTLAHSAQAEYLKEFFEYIGLMVHDEIVQDERDFDKHLSLANDVDGVDVFLNMPYYFVAERDIENRFYMNFFFDKKEVFIFQDRFSLKKQLALKHETKKETRIEALGLLIDAIWKDDEENRIAIQKIKDCYVPKDEERDLFYILQAVNLANKGIELSKFYNSTLSLTLGNGSFPTSIVLDDYVERMFSELWRMHCLLENNDNPYIVYAKINTAKILLSLYLNLSYLDQKDFDDCAIEYNNQKMQFLDYEDTRNAIRNLFKNAPWFKSLYVLQAKINDIFELSNSQIYKSLISESEVSRFPGYYSFIYCDIGCKLIEQGEFEKAKQYLSKAIEFDGFNEEARFHLGRLLYKTLSFDDNPAAEAELCIANNLYDYDVDGLFITSFSRIIALYKSWVRLFSIKLNSCSEYTIKHYLNSALQSAHMIYAHYILEIIDTEEYDSKYVQEFINSTIFVNIIYTLYMPLKEVACYLLEPGLWNQAKSNLSNLGLSDEIPEELKLTKKS